MTIENLMIEQQELFYQLERGDINAIYFGDPVQKNVILTRLKISRLPTLDGEQYAINEMQSGLAGSGDYFGNDFFKIKAKIIRHLGRYWTEDPSNNLVAQAWAHMRTYRFLAESELGIQAPQRTSKVA